MQLGRLALAIIISFIILIPLGAVFAENSHFDPIVLKQGAQFVSADNSFKLTVPADKYLQPVDVYLFKLPRESVTNEVNALTEVYSYYVYSSEVNEDSEFNVTLSYSGDHASAKTVYFKRPGFDKWQLASQNAFLNSLTFKLKGRENQLVVAGTNLPVQTARQNDKIQISEIYDFNVDLSLSQLDYKRICRPYLNGYFKSSKTNSEEEVKKLQTFLRENEGFSQLPSTGYYGALTANAVKTFQERYFSEVLKPYGLTSGTGWVLTSTLKKINEVYCQKNPQAAVYSVSLPYTASSKRAKSAYRLNNGDWEKLESYDDYKNNVVTAIIDKDSARLALFEENDEWVGLASWYAYKNGLYAASRDFAKGTRLKVINQSSGEHQGQFVIVEINDYGPELKTGRIIDLDKRAFEAISNLKVGVVSVKIEEVK